MMETLAWGVAFAALAYAVYNHFQTKKLSARCERLSDSLSRTIRKLELVEHTLSDDIAALRYDIKKQQGKLVFHEDMTFKEALDINPRVQEVMNEMHVGGCPDCAVDTNQTLAYGAAINSVDVRKFLVALNNLPMPEQNKRDKAESSKLKVLN